MKSEIRELFETHPLDSCEIRQKALQLGATYIFPKWSSLSIEHVNVRQITGGQSNLLYLAETTQSVGIARFLIRIYCQPDLEAITPNLMSFALLAERGLGPKMYGFFDGGRLEEFWECKTLDEDDIREERYAKKIGANYAIYHQVEMPFAKHPPTFEIMRRMLEAIRSRGYETHHINTTYVGFQDHPAKITIDEIYSEVELFENMCSRFDENIVFSHNDLAPANILELMDGRLKFIDFEYAFYNWRGYDVGMHMSEYGFDYRGEPKNGYKIEQEIFEKAHPNWKMICEEYIKKLNEIKRIEEPLEVQIDKLMLECQFFIPLTNLFWAIWSIRNHLIAHDNGIDLEAAANDRLAIYFHLKGKSMEIFEKF